MILNTLLVSASRYSWCIIEMVIEVRRAKIIGVTVIILLTSLAVLTPSQDQPQIEVSTAVEPSPIFVKGSGAEPQIATVKITLQGTGPERLPIDVMLVIDGAVSLREAREFGAAILDKLGDQDLVGLVSYATDAALHIGLTSNKEAVKAELEALRSATGAALSKAIKLANSELIKNGRPHAVRAQIVLIKALKEFGAISEAAQAKEHGIKIFPIWLGVNKVPPLLTQIASMTGGQAFQGPATAGLEDLMSALSQKIVSRQIKIKLTVTSSVTLEDTGSATVTDNPDGTKTLEWETSELVSGQTFDASFAVSSETKGQITISQEPSSVEFTDFAGDTQTLSIPSITLEVANQPPTADFEFSPADPSPGEDIQFKDKSSDADGTISSWSWDFGDGNTGAVQSPSHQYAEVGTFTVTLTVTDNDGATATASKPIEVAKIVTATRTIATFESNRVPRGASFKVTIEIEVKKELKGMGLDEDLPEGWEVEPIDSAGAVFKKDGTQWSFQEIIEPEEIKTVIYAVRVPKELEPGTFNITGSLISALPEMRVTVGGDSTVEVIKGISVREAVAHYDTERGVIDPKLPNTISFAQIQQATAWWLEGVEVPGTEGAVIDLKTMQELIAYWLTDTPVDQRLPR